MKKPILFYPPSFIKSSFTFGCLFFYFFLISSNILSQNTSKSVSAPEGEWNLYMESNGVKIFTQNDECHDFKNGTHYEYLMLKFVNTTNVNKKIKWSENLYYNGKCTNCKGNSDKPIFEFDLEANETKQGNCGTDVNDMFRIFNRFLNYTDKPVLTKYEFINLEIK
jgi:hypothetical protein